MKRDNKTDIYFQLWWNPIFNQGLLTIITPEEWQTLTALTMFMDENGLCYPTLSRIGSIIGIKWVSTVSKRIKSLEQKRFMGMPLIRVKRTRRRNVHGQLVYSNNAYLINPSVVSIFREHESKTIRREEQMERYQKDWDNLIDQLSMEKNDTKNNITRTSI